MRGRPLKPAEILKLERGKLYNKQAERVENTPVAKRSMEPVCPDTFTDEQKMLWEEYSAILKNYGLFTVANKVVLEQLCFWLDIFNRHREKLNDTDVLSEKAKGRDIYEKSFNVCKHVHPMIKSCIQELGLSSQGLAKLGSLTASAIKKKDDIERLLD